jgi:hypothetical protein
VPFEAFPERVSAFPLRFIENNNRFTFIIIISSSSSLEHERGQIDGRYLVHHPKNDTPRTFFTLVRFNELFLHSHQELLLESFPAGKSSICSF